MKRAMFALGGAVLLTLASVGGVAADKPIRGCPDDFQAWAIPDFRDYLNSEIFIGSLPQEGQDIAGDILAFINTDDWLAAGAFYDKNGDGTLCLKQKPANRGNLFGWMFNAVDNTSNHLAPA